MRAQNKTADNSPNAGENNQPDGTAPSTLKEAVLFFSHHSVQEFVKDVRTLPRNPTAVMAQILRGAVLLSTESKETGGLSHYVNGSFEFVVRLRLREGSEKIEATVVTCWQRFLSKDRQRWRDGRAREKQQIRRALRRGED